MTNFDENINTMEATKETLTTEQRRQRALEFCRYVVKSKQEMREQSQRDFADPNSALNESFRKLYKMKEENKHIHEEGSRYEFIKIP